MKQITSMFILIATLLALVISISACNYQMVDLNYKFDYAYISYGDGTVEKVEIASWRDYEDGDQIQITGTDGTVYLVHSESCILVKEGKSK